MQISVAENIYIVGQSIQSLSIYKIWQNNLINYRVHWIYDCENWIDRVRKESLRENNN